MHANLHIQTISRGARKSTVAASAYRSGSSVVACAAYRACDRLKDDRSGKMHDYSRKENVLHAEIITPDHAPDWMHNRQTFWNHVEAGEKRKDAQLAKEVILVLPRNMDHEQHKDVVRGWVKENVTQRNLVADYAIHNPDASDGGKNPHAHVMFNLRPVEEDGSFGKKLTGYKNGGLDGKAALQEMRFSYQDHLNRVSSANDNNERVFDLRSYREKGINRKPQPKRGPKVTHMEKRGYEMEHGKKVDRAIALNQAKQAQQNHARKTRKIGERGGQWGVMSEEKRQEVASLYYDIMYGDGTVGSFEEEQNRDGYGR